MKDIPTVDPGHPAAWRGRELATRPEWEWRLQEADVAELNAALAASRGLQLDEIDQDSFPLPRLRPRLHELQESLENGSGACRIVGLPIDAYLEDDAGRLFWGLGSYLGTPLSQSAEGERLFSVRDKGYDDDDSRARGPTSRKKLHFHTDRCDVIGFLCLQPAREGGENDVISSMSLFREIHRRRPDLAQVLSQPYYYQRHNVDTGNERPYCSQPIFSEYEGHFAANLLRVLIDRADADPDLPDMTVEQREALDYLEEVAEDPDLYWRFHLGSGDVLFLNNFVTLHRRTEFRDDPDPARRRHLLRLWLTVPNSRPLHPDFAGHYGDTRAGAIRGGMRPA